MNKKLLFASLAAIFLLATLTIASAYVNYPVNVASSNNPYCYNHYQQYYPSETKQFDGYNVNTPYYPKVYLQIDDSSSCYFSSCMNTYPMQYHQQGVNGVVVSGWYVKSYK